MIVVNCVLIFSAFAPLASSFTLDSPSRTFLIAATQRSSPFRLHAVLGGDEDGKKDNPKEDSDFSDFPVEGKTGDYTGSVDWDAEWKKVMANQGQPDQRPGKGYYKSEAELAALRAANQARETAIQATSSMPSMPTWDSVKNDWKVRCVN